MKTRQTYTFPLTGTMDNWATLTGNDADLLVNVLAIVSERFTLVGTDNRNLVLQGTDLNAITLEGTDDRDIVLTGN